MDYRLGSLAGFTIVMWGLWGFFGKLALQKGMAPTTIFLAEVITSAACTVPIVVVLFRSHSLSQFHTSWNVFGVLSGAGLALGLLCYYFALEKTQASILVPLTAIYPVVSVLLSYAVLQERLGLLQWVGVVLVVVGAMLLLSSATTETP
jgi:bacterial/archaeal transporter family protein